MAQDKRGCILVVEDDGGTCELEAQRLAPLGFEISKAFSEQDALAVLKACAPRLMLVDYSLPGTDALEFIRELRASGAEVPPFMLVTGRGDEKVAVAAMKAGALDYIVKTAGFLDDLQPAVLKALDKQKLLDDLAEAQESTARNLHLYTFLAQVNLAAARTKDRKDLFRRICETAVSAGGMRMAWIGLPDKDLGRLEPFCSAGFTDGYLDRIKIDIGGDTPSARGPSGRAAAALAIQACPDIAADPSMAPWREGALARGYLSSAAIPLQAGGRLAAVLSMYSGQPGFFSGGELNLLEEIAADISLALDAILAEEKRVEAQAALEITAGQLSHVMAANPVLLFTLRRKNGWVSTQWVSGNSAEMTGYEPAEALAPGWWEENLHPADRGCAMAVHKDLPREGVTAHDFRFKKKGGGYAWFHCQYRPGAPGSGEVFCAWTDITQRKESEMRFQELFEKSPMGYQSLDGGGNLLAVNDTWCAVFGYAREEVLGRNFSGFIAPKYKEAFAGIFSAFMAAGELKGTELEIKRKDGSSRFIVLNGKVVRKPDGTFKQTHCVLDDVTERREEKKQMRLLSDAVENSFDEVYIFSPSDFHFIFANRAASANLGYSAEEMKGLTPWSLQRVFTGASFGRAVAPLLDNMQQHLLYENSHTRKDGSSYPVEVRLQLVRSGEDRFFLAVINDITGRKRAEDSLETQRRLFSDVLDNSSSLIYACDREGRFIIANKALGLSRNAAPEDMIGKTRGSFMEAEAAQAQRANDLKVLESGVPMVFEETVPGPGGVSYYYSVKFPLKDQTGNIYAVGGISSDISERKNAERLVAEMASMQRVESLGELAGGIAHDFNNMLTGIMANLSLLEARVDGGENGELLRDTLKAAEGAQALTTQLLSFAKGGKPVKKEVCLEKALKDIFSLATRGSSAAKELNVRDSLWSVEGDENQIKQAVNNILINGIQSMPSGGTIGLKAENMEEADPLPGVLAPGKYVKITVSDSGAGIPARDLPRIFEPYFSTKSKGHGLGLSMTWSVVKNHGGHIEAASEPGKGTELRVFLPATGRCLAEDGLRPAPVTKGTGRILLLEDEDIVTRAAVRMLAELGYTCETTADGRQTLESYARQKAAGAPFDAVIMDLTIPGGMGGKEAGAELRRLDPESVIIVSSGYSEEPVMGEYKDFGFDAVLPKPYRYEELAQTLSRLLKRT